MTSAQDSVTPNLSAALRRGMVARCPAPSGGLAALVDAELTHFTASWQGRFADGDPETIAPQFVAIGAAYVARSNGPGRFDAVRSETEAVLSKLSECAGDQARQFRFFGGAAFAEPDASSAPWDSFGSTTFVLPRVMYVDQSDEAHLLVCPILDANGRPCTDPPAQQVEATVQLARSVLAEAAKPAHRSSNQPLIPHQRRDSCGPRQWASLIQAIKSGIVRGSFQKVVAARRISLELSGAPRLSDVLGRLSRQAPRCVRFSFRMGAATFLGASPERLIAKSRRELQTEALAGTIARDTPGAEQRLLESRKDRAEHDFVVRAIREGLEPLCTQFEAAETPQILTLQHLHHLRTPISGRLRDDLHVLELVRRLHPTPAVGGVPKQAAEQFIAKHESAGRGWYAAPIGWVDERGDGEFMVALRSALVQRERVAVFSGAGIVEDSDADLEYAETELKMRGMLAALGIETNWSLPGPQVGPRQESGRGGEVSIPG